VLLVLVAAAATASYLGTLGHGFVYDDHRFVEGNPRLGFSDAFDPAAATADGGDAGMWRPVRALSFALDRALLGPGPAGMHLSSALLHGVAAALVFALGMALALGDLGSAAGAALFALHPVQAEAVSWISARGDLLCAVFLLAATITHLRRTGAVVTAALVTLAFLSKEAAIAAPLLFVVADLAAGGTVRVRERIRPVAATAIGLLLLVGIRAAVLAAASVPFAQAPRTGIGAMDRIGDLPSMFAWYAGRFFVPTPGTFDHQLMPSMALAMAALAGVVVLASWERIGLPRAAAAPARCGALWAVAALVPVTLLQVIFPLKILLADRFLYLALAGPALAAGAAAAAVGPKAVRGVLVAAPLLLCATLPASARWASDGTLWQDTLDRDPGHPRALYGLAWAKEASAPGEARSLYQAYTASTPDDPGGWFRLGLTEEALGIEASDGPSKEGHLLLAVEPLGQAIRLWLAGEPEGRARGLLEARLARACVLAALRQQEAAKDEATEALPLYRQAPPDERARLRPRMGILLRWAQATGQADLARELGS
jgi:hypothetical protein